MINDFEHVSAMSELSKMTETVRNVKSIHGDTEDITYAFRNKRTKLYLGEDMLHFVTRFGVTPSSDELGTFITPSHLIELSQSTLDVMDDLYFGVIYTTRYGGF
jgi:hypothetical protein